jgi:hypothetical protein
MTYRTPKLQTVHADAASMIQVKVAGLIDTPDQDSKPQTSCALEAN